MVEITARGPTILLPVNPVAVEGERAEEMRKWGINLTLGRVLIDSLSDRYRVVAFDCVEIAGPLANLHDELTGYGWEVASVDDADHTKAMQPESVLPIIGRWLDTKLQARRGTS